MTNYKFLGICSLLISTAGVAWSVYAPIPELEQGKALSVSVTSGATYDDNIFGSSGGEIDSMVYRVSPRISFNASLDKQTFFSASYELDFDYFSDRPGDKSVESHSLDARLAHAFAPGQTLDLSDQFLVSRNPESLLSGVPINTDQSFTLNTLNAIYLQKVGQRYHFTLKGRNTIYRYHNDNLASSLDRVESLLGAMVASKLRPDLDVSAEYRYQMIEYDNSGSTKDKISHYFLAGADYSVGPKGSASVRVGAEARERKSEDDTVVPYAELTAKYDYGERSYVSGGYVYALEETSNVSIFTDILVSRFFVNVQHALSANIVASGSVTFAPSSLQTRAGLGANQSEDTLRIGLGLTWIPGKNWAISGTYDYDDVSSDVAGRDQTRNRIGAEVTYEF